MKELKHLLACIYHQKLLSRTNIIQSKATNVFKIWVYIPQESTHRKRANHLKKMYTLWKKKQFTSVEGTKP